MNYALTFNSNYLHQVIVSVDSSIQPGLLLTENEYYVDSIDDLLRLCPKFDQGWVGLAYELLRLPFIDGVTIRRQTISLFLGTVYWQRTPQRIHWQTEQITAVIRAILEVLEPTGEAVQVIEPYIQNNNSVAQGLRRDLKRFHLETIHAEAS